MKTLTLFLVFSFISNLALADCNWATGVTPLADGGYRYSLECHLEVGALVQNSALKDKQISDLNQAIKLKDLALTASDQRATTWSNTSATLEDRLQKVDSIEKKSEWLYYGLGCLTVIGAGFMAAKLIGR